MKIIIVSDSHGNFGILKKIVELEEPFHLMVHLGDGVEDAYRIQRIKEFKLDTVSGNNDPRDLAPEYLLLKFGEFNCFFTHGDRYEVNRDLSGLWRGAKSCRANIVFYGHTHCYNDCKLKGIRFLNPGTVSAYLNKEPSYLKMECLSNDLRITRVII